MWINLKTEIYMQVDLTYETKQLKVEMVSTLHGESGGCLYLKFKMYLYYLNMPSESENSWNFNNSDIIMC